MTEKEYAALIDLLFSKKLKKMLESPPKGGFEKLLAKMKSTSACFTGHRAQKLPWGFDEDDERCIAMKAVLKSEIEKAIQRGYDTFYCGMALGFDMICAEILIELRKTYDIAVIGAIPCKNQDLKWPKESKARYNNLLKQLNSLRCNNEKYNGAECMLERNRYMVDNSSLLIALYNGEKGGTQYTVDYARKQGLEVVTIEP